MKTAHDLVAAAKAHVQEIPVADAEQAIIDADVLVDVREADEFAAGHLAGAVHISRGMLECKFSANPALQARDMNILLHCKTSGRVYTGLLCWHAPWQNVQSQQLPDRATAHTNKEICDA